MTSKERLARLAAPTPSRRRRGGSIGDGDVCPVEPTHGSMMILRPSDGRPARQFCPHQTHDGTSRAFYPADIEPEALAVLASAMPVERTLA